MEAARDPRGQEGRRQVRARRVHLGRGRLHLRRGWKDQVCVASIRFEGNRTHMYELPRDYFDISRVSLHNDSSGNPVCAEVNEINYGAKERTRWAFAYAHCREEKVRAPGMFPQSQMRYEFRLLSLFSCFSCTGASTASTTTPRLASSRPDKEQSGVRATRGTRPRPGATTPLYTCKSKATARWTPTSCTPSAVSAAWADHTSSTTTCTA